MRSRDNATAKPQPHYKECIVLIRLGSGAAQLQGFTIGALSESLPLTRPLQIKSFVIIHAPRSTSAVI